MAEFLKGFQDSLKTAFTADAAPSSSRDQQLEQQRRSKKAGTPKGGEPRARGSSKGMSAPPASLFYRLWAYHSLPSAMPYDDIDNVAHSFSIDTKPELKLSSTLSFPTIGSQNRLMPSVSCFRQPSPDPNRPHHPIGAGITMIHWNQRGSQLVGRIDEDQVFVRGSAALHQSQSQSLLYSFQYASSGEEHLEHGITYQAQSDPNYGGINVPPTTLTYRLTSGGSQVALSTSCGIHTSILGVETTLTPQGSLWSGKLLTNFFSGYEADPRTGNIQLGQPPKQLGCLLLTGNTMTAWSVVGQFQATDTLQLSAKVENNPQNQQAPMGGALAVKWDDEEQGLSVNSSLDSQLTCKINTSFPCPGIVNLDCSVSSMFNPLALVTAGELPTLGFSISYDRAFDPYGTL